MKKCKICSNEFESNTRIYCSNKCKFSDTELNKIRTKKNILPDPDW